MSFGGRRPGDDRHIDRFPYAGAVRSMTPAKVDAALAQGVRSKLPGWHLTHDQGEVQPSCVGHATAMERAITNTAQRRERGVKPYSVRYDPIQIWRRAKAIDEWPESKPEDDTYGTSARAAYDVLRLQGARPIRGVRFDANGLLEPTGVRKISRTAGALEVNRWCRNVDEVRAAFAEGCKAVPLALPWYSGFEPWSLEWRPDADGRHRYWMRPNPRSYQGGGWRYIHELCLFGADDRVDAFWIKNSQGDSWGEHSVALLPYAALADAYGYWAEAVVVVDR